MSKDFDEDKHTGDSTDEENTGDSRRKLLKSLAAGSAAVAGQEVLPDDWKKPLMDTIVLPGHAQTTSDDDDDSGGDTSADDSSDSQNFDDGDENDSD